MLESTLRCSKTVSKKYEMMAFIKSCDQYTHKLNFGHFFSSLDLISLRLGGDDKNQGDSFA